MKILTKIFFFLLACLVVCCNKKDDFNYPEGTVAGSRITYFPILTVNGSSLITVALGGTYTDPGVTAKEAGTTIPVTTSGTVNTAMAGVYALTYSAVNKDGFSATASRTVVVYSTAEDAAANDFSGTYLRAATGATATWTKIAPGVYSVLNPGGAVAATLTAVVFNASGTTIKIPSQRTNDGYITSSSTETYTKTGTPSYSWIILNPGYGTGLRTFVKQ